MFDNPLSSWGTCNLENFDSTYNAMLNAQGPEEYEEILKELQKIASEDVIGIALCWDTAYYPYRTDKYEGWINYPGWGVINNETWYNLRPIA
jgi:peptide/nickel transport system substrate-binding protein